MYSQDCRPFGSHPASSVTASRACGLLLGSCPIAGHSGCAAPTQQTGPQTAAPPSSSLSPVQVPLNILLIRYLLTMKHCAYSISSLNHAADIDSQVQVLIQQVYLFIQLSGFHLFDATLSHMRMQCVCHFGKSVQRCVSLLCTKQRAESQLQCKCQSGFRSLFASVYPIWSTRSAQSRLVARPSYLVFGVCPLACCKHEQK